MRDRGSYRTPGAKAPEERRPTIDADGLDEEAFLERLERKRATEAHAERARLARQELGLRTFTRPKPTRAQSFGADVVVAGCALPALLTEVYASTPSAPLAACAVLLVAIALGLKLTAYLRGIRAIGDLTQKEWREVVGIGALGLFFGCGIAVLTLA